MQTDGDANRDEATHAPATYDGSMYLVGYGVVGALGTAVGLAIGILL